MPASPETVDFGRFANIVDGKSRAADQVHHGIDPTTKQPLWPIPIATDQDVEDATAAAQRAFSHWSQTTYEHRQTLLKDYKRELVKHGQELTKCLISESGKPKNIAQMEFDATLEMLDWYIDLHEPVLDNYEDHEKVIHNVYEALGTVVAITPWNFPLLLPISKTIPALLMGNVVILKPSPYTPYTSIKATEIAQQVFPAGVVQALNGDEKLGPLLVSHPAVHKISFTGSTTTGKHIMASAAKTMKRVTLELGGNDACIVLPDVDVNKAAFHVALGGFFNSGQVCVAIKRAFIHQSIYEPFVQAIAGIAATFKVGNPYEEGVMLGPIQNAMQFDKIKGFIQDSKTYGHKFAAGTDVPTPSDGYFIQPTIIDNPPAESCIFSEEQFGPIIPCQPWSDEDDVIRRANDSAAGLGATIFGANDEQTFRIAKKLQCGQVWINNFPKPSPGAHFGGHKESGIGTENGTAGIVAYANIKSIYVYKTNSVAKL